MAKKLPKEFKERLCDIYKAKDITHLCFDYEQLLDILTEDEYVVFSGIIDKYTKRCEELDIPDEVSYKVELNG